MYSTVNIAYLQTPEGLSLHHTIFAFKPYFIITVPILSLYIISLFSNLFIYLFENPSIIQNEKDRAGTYKYKKIYKNISEETQLERDSTNKRANKITLK